MTRTNPRSDERRAVLLVEDERLLSWSITKDLTSWGYSATPAGTLGEARAALGAGRPWAVLLDIRLPDGRGLDLLAELPAELRDRVIVMSAFGDTSTIVEAMRLGAADFLSKPFEPAQLQEALGRMEATHPTQPDRPVRVDFDRLGIVSRNPKLRLLMDRLRCFAATPRSTILILGETGAGKNVFARAVHGLSARRDRPFVEVNCAAIPHSLIESELMGYERGAFTNAMNAKRGLIEEANGGTLLLDEIGDMPIDMQAKMLNFIESGAIRRLGSTREVHCDVRIIAATHRDLKTEVGHGRFREDLFYRLKVLTVDVPPLRTRPEDIDLLADQFLTYFAHEMKSAVRGFSPEARRMLRAHPWPGNVRELKHVIEAAATLAGTSPLVEPDHLPAELAVRLATEPVAASAPAAMQAAPGEEGAELRIPFDGSVGLDDMEREVLRQAMSQCNGNQVRAAALLRVGRDLLRYRLKKHGLVD